MTIQYSIGKLTALVIAMESDEPITELQSFYLRRDDYARQVANFRTAGLGRLLSNFDAELDRQRTIKPNFPARGTYDLPQMAEMAFASYADRRTAGTPMQPFYIEKLTELLVSRGQPDLSRRFDAAAHRHMGKLHVSIMHDEAKLNGLQASVPRLRITLKDVQQGIDGTYANFETVCEECGSCDLTFPDGDDTKGPAVCVGCGHVFGSRLSVEKLAKHVAVPSGPIGTEQ